MTKTTEELILQELFNLNHKIDKFQDETRERFKVIEEKMATKDELKVLEEKMATKEDLKIYATKEDLKDFATKSDLKYELKIQAEEISDVFHETFRILQSREDNLRNEFILKQG